MNTYNNIYTKVDINYNYNWQDIDNEICLLLSKADLSKYPSVAGPIPPNMKDTNFDEKLENEIVHNLSNEVQNQIKNLNYMEKRKYLFFKKSIIIPWFFILDLKENKFNNRAYDRYDWSPITEAIPLTKQLIKALPFKEIGRVVIYGSWPGAKVPCHRDTPDETMIADQLNFNPGGYRPVFVYDEKTNVKHYLPKNYNFYFFNTSLYHGVDALPYFSYTVRVDGQFTDKFKRSIGAL